MKNTIFKLTEYVYYFSLLVLLILYLFPGSLIGYFLYGNLGQQPNLIANPSFESGFPGGVAASWVKWATGTEPVFKVSEVSEASMSIALDEAKSDLHRAHHNFVTDMKWTMDASDPNAMVFENSVLLDGEVTNNRAELKRSM